MNEIKNIERLIKSVGATSCIVTSCSVDAEFNAEMKSSAEMLRDNLSRLGYEAVMFCGSSSVQVNATMVTK